MARKQSENLKIVDTLLNSKGKTDYRKELANREPEMKKAKKIEKDRSWCKSSGYEATEFNNPIARNGSSIRPARCDSNGGIVDTGGSSKQVGVTGKNSVWDSDVLSKAANTPSSKERVIEEKQSSQNIRKKMQSEYKQSMSPRMGEDTETMPSKSSISDISSPISNRGWVPANKHSIFDTNDNFERLAKLTDRVSPKTEEPKKDASKEVKMPSKALSSKDLSHRFVDGILDQSKDTSYKSMHSGTVDRLYKILSERNSKE